MELRDIEIFLTLAEELHFGRTAERLHVSQARVSQAIRKQERRIGSPLFDRTSRRVELTPIGHKLRDDLRQAYDLIQGGLARAAAAGSGLHGTLRLGVMGALGNELRPVIEKFEARYAECDVLISEFHFSDPFGGLRAGEVDVQLMWLPIREPDLVHGPSLLTEGRVLAVASTSPLADRASVSLEDLGDLVVLDPGTVVPAYWIESMLPQRTPQGRVIRRGQVARTFHEVLGHIAGGRLVSPLNAHVSRYYSYPGIRFVPIEDAPLTEWALVWPRASAADPILKAFVDTVQGG